MDTILIVEDELSVRTTLKEWLAQSRLDLKILVASDAAGALQEASQHAIDLAILDWNLGAGLNGLQLLEDLHEFQRELVAILITGYANQATPLDALRLGVRDYLDKNHDFTRDRFLASVRRQLERILPQKRERLIHQQLVRFRAVVQEALPKLETACALQQEGITLENTLKVLLTHARQLTRAQAAFLYLHRPLPPPGQKAGLEVYNQDGQRLSTHPAGEYSHTLAAAIASMAPEVINTSLAQISQFAAVQLSPHETAHQQLLGMTLL
ncbi:MAG TPA: response regulator, partial [Gemmatales bacterium]|nr:response regulator [Gemmatales bacterium]